jgi:trehalose 6-phosphate phosphatase
MATMQPIMARENLTQVAALARTRLLVAFDFDGTLAPIVARPHAAVMRASTDGLFRALASLYPVAVITGRARADVVHRLPHVEGLQVIGNHGIELWRGVETGSVEVRRWLRVVRPGLARLQGVAFEDKGHSLAIHYRRARNKSGTLREIEIVLSRLRGVRVVRGKQVFDVLPMGGANKGAALQRLRRSLGCSTALYVGDDTTDEDVFALGPSAELMTVRVGRSRASAAAFYLPSQSRIDDFMEQLIRMRGASSPSGPGMSHSQIVGRRR